MPRALISYDKDLPTIAGRLAWEEPTSHLVKDDSATTGWREQDGRRDSQLLLISKIRDEVKRWREAGYPGASQVSMRLFEYWFQEDHAVLGYPIPFRFYFCQREAIETLIWLTEVVNKRDVQEMIKSFADVYKRDLLTDNIVFQTTMNGRRQVRRYIPEIDREGVQDLPPENLRRFAFKMATGSGKTWVMAMTIVWAHFHKKMVPDSELSTNFLVIAPNIIVYQRLEKDFASNRVFRDIPLIPPEWRDRFSQKVFLRGEDTEPDPSGNLFITNIQQLYESGDREWTAENAIDVLLGPNSTSNLTSSNRSMLERIKELSHLVVLNDEAHHVHDQELQWSQSLLSIHRSLPNGLAAWLDFSATPKDQNGMYFPWTICDYPLAQAVEDRIVKAPIIVTKEDDPDQPTEDPDSVTAKNAPEKYQYWLHAAVQRWREHESVLSNFGTVPVLFIMAERNNHADAIGEYLRKTSELGFKDDEVLVIHTDTSGDINKKDLDAARAAARDIDSADNKVKVIVSVMMLREGWDVRNVTVVLGLRPFSARAEILPEQVVGRGRRLLSGVSPDRTQTLEVLGTRNLLRILHGQLESEGVGVVSTSNDPPLPVTIEAIKERAAFDIAIPLTKPSLTHDMRKLSDFETDKLQPIFEEGDLEEPFRNRLKMEFATTETEVHSTDLAAAGDLPQAQQLLASITNKVTDRGKLPNRFAELYPRIKSYVASQCFGKSIDVHETKVREHLRRLEVQEAIAAYLARIISNLTVERQTVEFEKAEFRLSQTKSFQWRRNLPPLQANKTIFNYVATYNDFERQFAEFLDQAGDVARFASLGTTDQGDSGTQFRVNYIKTSGAIGFYHPDWVVVQNTDLGEVNWVIETKGRVWEGTTAKDAAMTEWCRRLATDYGIKWQYVRVNQDNYNTAKAKTLAELLNPVTSAEL